MKSHHTYKFGREIGSGATSHVFLASCVETQQECVCKIINKEYIETEEDARHLRNELSALQNLNHPNIVKYVDFIETPATFQLFMEYCPGQSLLTYVNDREGLDEFNTWRVFQQLISVIIYLHANNIVHRDLKPENIIIDDSLNIKVIDFGLCSIRTPNTLLETFCGSLLYVAPECLKHQPYLGPNVDIWSLGVILYAIRAGCLPWNSTNVQAVMHEIILEEIDYPPEFSPALIKLLKFILVKDPKERPSAVEISHDPWVQFGPNSEKHVITSHSSLPSIRTVAVNPRNKFMRSRRAHSFDFNALDHGSPISPTSMNQSSDEGRKRLKISRIISTPQNVIRKRSNSVQLKTPHLAVPDRHQPLSGNATRKPNERRRSILIDGME